MNPMLVAALINVGMSVLKHIENEPKEEALRDLQVEKLKWGEKGQAIPKSSLLGSMVSGAFKGAMAGRGLPDFELFGGDETNEPLPQETPDMWYAGGESAGPTPNPTQAYPAHNGLGLPDLSFPELGPQQAPQASMPESYAGRFDQNLAPEGAGQASDTGGSIWDLLANMADVEGGSRPSSSEEKNFLGH